MEEPGRNASQNGTLSEGQGSAILISFIYSVVCLVGLCGNSMVIYVILRYAKMKTATNIYILNLAIADELLMLSVPFLVTSTLLRHWPFGALLCRLVLSVDAVNMFTSIYCLTVLSVDRYVAVVHPIKAARYRRPTVAKVVNLGVWVLSLLVILPIVVFSRTAANSDGTVACNMLMPEPAQRWLVGFVLYTFLMGFLLPVGAICLCYVLIIAKMRMVALKAGWQQRKRSERKITLMVMMVVMVFVICWMPFYVVQLVNVFAEQDDATVSQLSVILGYANSCANPILYGFLSDNGACCLGWNLSWNLSWNFRALHRHDKPQCPTQNVGPPLQWNLSDRAGKSALWSERRSGVHSLRCHSEVGCARRQKGVSKGVTSPALTPWPEIRDPRTRLRLRGEIRRVWRVRRRWIVQGRGLPSSHAHRIRVLRAAKMALAVGARAPLRPEPDPGARL